MLLVFNSYVLWRARKTLEQILPLVALDVYFELKEQHPFVIFALLRALQHAFYPNHSTADSFIDDKTMAMLPFVNDVSIHYYGSQLPPI